MDLLIENVRSFAGKHTVPLKPLTLIVGENSTGKSTVLAGVAIVSHPEFLSGPAALTAPPFDLGSYDSIATYRKVGKAGKADSFSVGFSQTLDDLNSRILGTYKSVRGQPRLNSFSILAGNKEVRASLVSAGISISMAHVSATGRRTKVVSLKTEQRDRFGLSVNSVYQTLIRGLSEGDRHAAFDFFDLILPRGRRYQPPTYSLAPIRSKPRRTYDQVRDDFTPEGGHIPLRLSQLWQEGGERKAAVQEALVQFGTDSGLLSGLEVRHLGKIPGDPFQLMVKLGGPRRNLADVGYGISQSLPLIVQSVLAARGTRLLVQQPEVHLHPRAQAGLGSFFARMVAAHDKHMIVETHSDYLIDRIRQEVALGSIEADQVQILFLERKAVTSKVHAMSLDQHGNVLGAPPGYRRFFLDEEMRLLSRSR